MSVTDYRTNAHARALTEARDCLASLDAALVDTAEQLAAAGAEADAVRERWDALGATAARAHGTATSDRATNDAAAEAVATFHAAVAERARLEEPRREADARARAAERRLAGLQRLRDQWGERLDQLEDGTLPIAEPAPVAEDDASPDPVDLPPALRAVSAGSEGAPTPSPARRPGFLGRWLGSSGGRPW